MNRTKFFWWAVLFLVFTIPVSQYLSARVLFGVFLFSFFVTDLNRPYLDHLKKSWDLFLYLIVISLGLIYSEDALFGLKVLESNLSFLVIPIIFSRIGDLTEKQFNDVFNSFALGLLTSCLICLIHASIIYGSTGDVNSFFFYDLTSVLNFQPTYFAYFLIFTITYILYRVYYESANVNHLFQLVGALFFFLILMLTGGQTAFVSMLLIFSFFILKFIIEDRSKEKEKVVVLVSVMLVGMFLISLIDKEERGLALSDAWDRLVLWESAVDATPNLLFGVGTGDYKSVLNQYYEAHHLQKFADENFNSHNQFIQLLFSNGLLGIFSLIALISRPLYWSAKNHNLLGVLLVFPFLIYGVTEVFLGRYQGIIFFVLVHQLCILQIRTDKKSTYQMLS